jgi:hypothetical protein
MYDSFWANDNILPRGGRELEHDVASSRSGSSAASHDI